MSTIQSTDHREEDKKTEKKEEEDLNKAGMKWISVKDLEKICSHVITLIQFVGRIHAKDCLETLDSSDLKAPRGRGISCFESYGRQYGWTNLASTLRVCKEYVPDGGPHKMF